jgi:hypothetical protein
MKIELDHLRLHAVTQVEDLGAVEDHLGLRQPRACQRDGSFEVE